MGSFDPFAAMVGPVFDPFQTAGTVPSDPSGGILSQLLGLGNILATRFLGPQQTLPAPPTWSIGGTPAPRTGMPSPTFPMPGFGGNLPYNIAVNVRGRLARFHKRMNPCNPRALRRAITRVKRFEKFAKQSVRISHTVKMRKGRKRTCR